jgi:transcriptional regulator with XRE-family HTH domain
MVATRSKTQPRYPNRLRALRERQGLTLQDVADRTGLSYATVSRRETGDRQLKVYELDVFARALGCAPEEILSEGAHRLVSVVGRVGAGEQVFPLDDHPPGEGLYKVECPRGLDPAVTVAVEIVGDSMPPFEERSVVFYSREPEPDAAAIVGRLCVVKVQDGPTLFKRVRRGYQPGRFNLVSNSGAIMEDVALEWAGPVKAVLAPDVVRKVA